MPHEPSVNEPGPTGITTEAVNTAYEADPGTVNEAVNTEYDKFAVNSVTADSFWEWGDVNKPDMQIYGDGPEGAVNEAVNTEYDKFAVNSVTADSDWEWATDVNRPEMLMYGDASDLLNNAANAVGGGDDEEE